ncbi:MinD/ParA family protein [Fontivita pretiosa]|uniref:MinD/ParA family protein n=1 Tax=Fontivita pretiosa TaxID=2989684 RepID=UPI003D164ADC
MTVLMDQAAQLRSLIQQQQRQGQPPAPQQSAPQVRPAQRKRATVIAVTSGKGGVGKSNVAVNLAIQLAGAGRDVVLLDADLGLANADVLCNVDLPFNLSHVIARKKELFEVLFKAPGGFRLIGGASGLARMADLSDFDRQRIVEALGELESRTDIIIIDTGAGISPNVLSFTRAADHVLVVTTPEPTAITDAYAVIKVLSRGGVGAAADASTQRRISLLVNQARSASESRVVYERIAKVAKQFLNVDVYEAGYVPADENVPLAVRRRTPFLLAAPRCPASQGIAQLAMRLEQGLAPRINTRGGGAGGSGGGFFSRMVGWLSGGCGAAPVNESAASPLAVAARR